MSKKQFRKSRLIPRNDFEDSEPKPNCIMFSDSQPRQWTVEVKVEPVDENNEIILDNAFSEDLILKQALEAEAAEISKILEQRQTKNSKFENLRKQHEDKFANFLSRNSDDGTLIIRKMYCDICRLEIKLNMQVFSDHLVERHPDPRIFDLKVENEVAVVYFNIDKNQSIPEDELKCFTCDQEFQYRFAWTKHHMKDEQVCTLCSLRFQNCKELLVHKNNCTGVQYCSDYKCTICFKFFRKASDLAEHKSMVHIVRSDALMPNVRLAECQLCKQMYPGNRSTHYCPEMPHKFACNNCLKTFPTSLMIKCHNKAYKRRKGETCTHCKKVLKRECEILSHKCEVLDETIMFQCLQCSRNFSNRDGAVSHLTVEHKYNVNMNFEKLLLRYQISAEPEVKQINQTQTLPKPKNSTMITQVDDCEVVIENPHDDLQNETASSALVLAQLLNGNTDDTTARKHVYVTNKEVTDLDYNLKEEPVNILETTDDDDDVVVIEPEIPQPIIIPDDGMSDDIFVTVKTEPMEVDESDDITAEPITEVCVNDIKIEPIEERSDMVILHENADLLTVCGHKVQKDRPPKLKCQQCLAKFDSVQDMIEHVQTTGCTSYHCSFCDYICKSIEEHEKHLLPHIKIFFSKVKIFDGKKEIKAFQCIICTKVVFQKNLQRHWIEHVNKDVTTEIGNYVKNDSVPVVKVKTESAENDIVGQLIGFLLKKKKGMKLENRFCIVCEKGASRSSDFKRHIIEHLLDDAHRKSDTLLECQICMEALPNPSLYRQHMRKHGELPLYQCSLCSKSFSDSSNYTKHRKVHNVSVMVCDLCQRKFSSRRMLINHIERHRQTQPAQCKLCPQVFPFQTNLNRHMKSCHMQIPKYICQKCKQSFYTLKHKWNHMWYQHHIRKVKADCPYCNASFRRKHDVKTHVNKEHVGMPQPPKSFFCEI